MLNVTHPASCAHACGMSYTDILVYPDLAGQIQTGVAACMHGGKQCKPGPDGRGCMHGDKGKNLAVGACLVQPE